MRYLNTDKIVVLCSSLHLRWNLHHRYRHIEADSSGGLPGQENEIEEELCVISTQATDIGCCSLQCSAFALEFASLISIGT